VARERQRSRNDGRSTAGPFGDTLPPSPFTGDFPGIYTSWHRSYVLDPFSKTWGPFSPDVPDYFYVVFIEVVRVTFLKGATWRGGSNCRHEDFQSSYRSGTMAESDSPYRSSICLGRH